ncbi:hypothetical protein FHR71_003943 [Methylobacterium sp. RAS18]|nr:hypothetical protein [Methylobacterium sp. RAS18]
MAVLAYLRTRILIWQARHHAETARRLWLASEEHRRRLGACLDRIETDIATGRVVLSR